MGQALDHAASSFPDRPALTVRHQSRRYTYREFRDEVELAARGFLRLGINKGERVGIWATNCSEWTVTQFAAAKTAHPASSGLRRSQAIARMSHRLDRRFAPGEA